MKYRGIFEYEYPTEHKPPISIDVYLHGDCVKGKIIEWEYRPQEQESILDKIFCIVHPLSIMSTPELEHKAIMQITEMLEPLCLPEGEEEE